VSRLRCVTFFMFDLCWLYAVINSQVSFVGFFFFFFNGSLLIPGDFVLSKLIVFL